MPAMECRSNLHEVAAGYRCRGTDKYVRRYIRVVLACVGNPTIEN
ncbi:MAG TPA: hypothetical protein TECP_00202 [Hyphomicrobiaceae bacterium MAG_BT-2024]